MKNLFSAALFLALAFSLSSQRVLADPPVAQATATVSVGGEVGTALSLDLAALAKLPRQRVEATAHDTSGTWEGVALADILRAAGVPMDEKLRGKNLSLYVRISASEGYRAVFALAELDPGIRDSQIILADHHDGKPMDTKEGPFRIIAAGEKRPARWVRQVTSIDVLRAPDK
jgi:hypothetical protein